MAANKTSASAKAGLDIQTLDWRKLLALLQAILSLFAVRPPVAYQTMATSSPPDAEKHQAACESCCPGLWDYLQKLDYPSLLELFREVAVKLGG